MKASHFFRLCARLVLAACLTAPAAAQIPDLGGVTSGAVGGLDAPLRNVQTTTQDLGDTAVRELRNVRLDRIRELVRGNRGVIDTDRAGAPVIRNEVVAIAPSTQALAAAQARGFTTTQTIDADALGLSIMVLRAPEGMSTRRALDTLGELDPQGVYDFNHLYLGAGDVPSNAHPTRQSNGGGGGAARIGLIDSGVDDGHTSLSGAGIRQRGFVSPQAVADTHGTAIASLLVGSDGGFRGAAPGATLYVADVYGGVPTGGGAAAIVSAFNWLASERATVINVSLVGPPNRALEAGVRAIIARGYVIVAAVGNDGPAAAPLYPAAYDGVIGVTGVDARNRALPEAGRGAQVDFAAPGSDIAAAAPNGRYARVRGTSFAAPIVAGLLARRLSTPDPVNARRAEAALATDARDLGTRGPDRTYGAGLVGGELRASTQQAALR